MSVQKLFSIALGTTLLLCFAVVATIFSRDAVQRAENDTTREARVILAAAIAARSYSANHITPLIQKDGEFHREEVPAFAVHKIMDSFSVAFPEYTYTEKVLNPTNLDNLAQQLHSIAEHNSEVKVIVFTGNLCLDFHEEALRNGARGVLLKHCAPELIAKTIRKVSRGGLCFDRALTDRMLSTFVRRKQTELPPEIVKISSLTGRENQVISRICEGMHNKEIASKLFISNATVAHHLTSIYRKLDLADRTELLLYAHHNGLSPI